MTPKYVSMALMGLESKWTANTILSVTLIVGLQFSTNVTKVFLYIYTVKYVRFYSLIPSKNLILKIQVFLLYNYNDTHLHLTI